MHMCGPANLESFPESPLTEQNMMKERVSSKEIRKQLSASDAKIGDLFDLLGFQEIGSAGFVTPLSLCKRVIGQQLSTKAASTIQRRFSEKVDGCIPNLTEEDLHLIRSAGVSTAKSRTILRIAALAREDEEFFNRLSLLSDEDVREALTRIKGIGPWTADMTLIFDLGRRNVFSKSDGSLNRAIHLIYDADEIDDAIASWSPYRTYVSLLLWKFIDTLGN